MASDLLNKTRRVTKLLQITGAQSMRFSDLCEILGEILHSKVYVISKKGKVLGLYLGNEVDFGNVIEQKEVGGFINEAQNEELLYVKETRENVKTDALAKFSVLKGKGENVSITIIPISSEGERLGTLFIDKTNGQLSDDDLVVAEYGATVVGMEILRSINIENETEIRERAVVQLAIGSLSYSEKEAIVNVIKELNEGEGLLVASKIADKAGITRSVIVNALRKFESAGVIESRSLGMKGTYIKILNDKLLEELCK